MCQSGVSNSTSGDFGLDLSTIKILFYMMS